MILSNYDEIRHLVKTGDIVLFSGSGFVSRLIKFATRSKWSHVGIIYRPDPDGTVFIYESTTLSPIKNKKGSYTRGVQTVDFRSRLRTYKGSVAIRLLESDLTNEQLLGMEAVRDEMRNKPYERSRAELAKSILGKWGIYQKADSSSQFCSELVAYCLQGMKVLTKNRSANSYTPADLARTIRLVEPYDYSQLHDISL